MMQILCDHIDQLDLALDQLALKDRNFDRFAIVLVDNVVELTLHQHALDRQIHHNQRYVKGQTESDLKAMNAALGQNFDAKVSFALHTGLLTKPMSQSINWLHSFRNSSYHAGMRHEGILNSLANFYLRTCCDLLSRYRPAFWSFGAERVSHRAAKYLGSCDELEVIFKAGEMFDAAWKRLGAVAFNMQSDLKSDLSRDLANTIDRVDRQITFIADNAPSKGGMYTRNEVVADAQAWAMAFTQKGIQYAQKNGYQGRASFGSELGAWLAQNYTAPFPGDPVPKWKIRLGALKQEKDEHKALEKYCNFMKQTQGVRDDIARQARLLDGAIQEQIDWARGK